MEQGTLRIGASTTPASYLLPYLIADFHRRYPDVTLHAADGNTTEIVGALGTLDIAMIEGPVGMELPPDTAVHAWREDEIVAIMPRTHPLAQAASAGVKAGDGARVELAACGMHPLVLRETGSGVRQIVERAFARAGVPMRVALEIAGVEGVKEAVRGLWASASSRRCRCGTRTARCACSRWPRAADTAAVDSGAACECAVAGRRAVPRTLPRRWNLIELAWGFPLWCMTARPAHYSGIASASALFFEMCLEPVPIADQMLIWHRFE
jgi:Transcriptional regulator